MQDFKCRTRVQRLRRLFRKPDGRFRLADDLGGDVHRALLPGVFALAGLARLGVGALAGRFQRRQEGFLASFRDDASEFHIAAGVVAAGAQDLERVATGRRLRDGRNQLFTA